MIGSAPTPTRHAGEGRYPRLAFVAAKQVVDTGLRRHDEVGTAPMGQSFRRLVLSGARIDPGGGGGQREDI
jgi:hypothetical protein